MKRTIQWMIVGLLMGVFLIGCGQGSTNEEQETNEEAAVTEEAANEETTAQEETATNQGSSQSEQMTAAYIGLIDNHSFQAETEDGKVIPVRFSEQFYDELEPLMGGMITFAYEIDENGQYQLVEIIEILEQ